ncbi:hypothetical protein ES754_06715 [Psychrobacter frigidicola]|uniref:Uncharacterized protein n=1 Tax=Psychrobacter frigidicola TaxID=45611 RepID=A0A5C7A4L1_9GAMM|nr:hypothetical protein [Psychrobacter frigidicola]TXD96733.1 hypothetical protein ES754_06715 [Psychrobacter frigidicola]
MEFGNFKDGIIAVTGLDKDALHMYVGISIYLLCLILLRPIFKKQSVRSFIALIAVTCIALLGEYLDNRHTIAELGLSELGSVEIKASIHDIINTCLLSYVLYALTLWTKTFQTVSKPSSLLKQR